RKVRPGGRMFLMIYATPTTYAAYRDVNLYESIAAEHSTASFEDRRADLTARFGSSKAHGWFDATSPRINDRLTFEEIRDLLHELKLVNVTGHLVDRDHFIVADRPLT